MVKLFSRRQRQVSATPEVEIKEEFLLPDWMPVSRRHKFLLEGIDYRTARGVEFGALNYPTVPKEFGTLTIVDYTTTAGLRAQHAHLPERASGIAEVDYVWSGSGSLAEVIGERELFDFAIASHVIEHVPNTLGWFRGIAEVLKAGAVFNLAIPDKRFTFDIERKLSTAGELIEADLLGFTRPSIRQMIDHCIGARDIGPGAIWEQGGAASLQPLSGEGALDLAMSQANTMLNGPAYFDSHCWVYTPQSFLSLLETAIKIDRFGLIPERLGLPEPGDFEFLVTLRKPSTPLDQHELRDAQLRALDGLRSQEATARRQSTLLAGD